MIVSMAQVFPNRGAVYCFGIQATKVAFVAVAEGFSPPGGSVGASRTRLAAPRGHPDAGYINEACLRRLNTSRKHTPHPQSRERCVFSEGAPRPGAPAVLQWYNAVAERHVIPADLFGADEMYWNAKLST